MHFVYGYHYTPRVAKNFTNDLTLIQDHLKSGTILLINPETDNYDFYKLLENYSSYTIVTKLPERIEDASVAVLGDTCQDERLELKEIITSPKTRNSDRLYIYSKITTKTTEQEGEE